MNNLLWRCRRGTKELDLLLESYVKANAGSWRPSKLQQFEELLGLSDDVLITWLVEGNCPKSSEFFELISDIKLNYLKR